MTQGQGQGQGQMQQGMYDINQHVQHSIGQGPGTVLTFYFILLCSYCI
jgi:hypothetical protein